MRGALCAPDDPRAAPPPPGPRLYWSELWPHGPARSRRPAGRSWLKQAKEVARRAIPVRSLQGQEAQAVLSGRLEEMVSAAAANAEGRAAALVAAMEQVLGSPSTFSVFLSRCVPVEGLIVAVASNRGLIQGWPRLTASLPLPRSTFTDTQRERNGLHADVFPFLVRSGPYFGPGIMIFKSLYSSGLMRRLTRRFHAHAGGNRQTELCQTVGLEFSFSDMVSAKSRFLPVYLFRPHDPHITSSKQHHF